MTTSIARFIGLGCLSLALILPSALAETLKKDAMDAIIDHYREASLPDSFDAFTEAVVTQAKIAQDAVTAYHQGKTLAGDDLINIGRLLGLYNRLRNEETIIDWLAKLVALQTYRDPNIPPYNNDAIIAAGQWIETLAKEAGLEYRNVDNRIFEVKLPGSGNNEFGILTHVDVVPVNVDEWVLDGTPIDPFKLTLIDGKMYGRGTIDDKGPIASALFAMKAVKDSGITLQRGIRLMIETTEETGGEGMEYYRKNNSLPQYNIVLDSRYPAVIAEKGAGYLRAYFPLNDNTGDVIISEMVGAPAANTIPASASATLIAKNTEAVLEQLAAAKTAYIDSQRENGGEFTIDLSHTGEQIKVVVNGVSAHGSRPEEGINPVPRLSGFLMSVGDNLNYADNHYRRACQYINDIFGLGFLGKKLGVAYADDFMGPLTVTPTYFKVADGKLEVAANMRIPRGKSAAEVKALVAAKLDDYTKNKTDWGVKFVHKQDDWMARDPKGAWLATLLNIFADTTGLEAKPVSTAGSTTAKLMPNAINFGPSMPGFKYTAHGALEYHLVEHMYNDMRMFTEMMLRIGNLGSME